MATFNPADKKNALVVLSNGDLTVTGTDSAGNNWVRSNLNRSGRRYVEFTIGLVNNSCLGIADASTLTFPGANAQSFGLFNNGFGSVNNTFPDWGGGAGTPYNVYTTGDVLGMAVDLTAKRVWFRKNGGVWNGNALNDPTATQQATLIATGAEASGTAGTTITATAPTGLVFGDIVILSASCWLGSATASAPAGWTSLDIASGGSSFCSFGVWWCRYNGTALPSSVVTFSGSSGNEKIAAMAAFRGCKASGSPFNATGTDTAGTATSITHSSITTTVDNCLILLVNGTDDNDTRTLLAGFTNVFEDVTAGTDNSYRMAGGASLSMFHQRQTTAGAVGAKVVAGVAGGWHGVMLALEGDSTPGTGWLDISAYAGTTHFVVSSSGAGGSPATNGVHTANFGETAFGTAAPSGFLAWNAETVIQTTPPVLTISTKTVTAGVFATVAISGLTLGMTAKGAQPLAYSGAAATVAWGLHTSLAMTPQPVVGDLNIMAALVSTSGVPPTITPPAGWTQIFTPTTVSDGSTGVTFYAWWKKTAAGDGTQIFTHSSANSIGWMPSFTGAAGSPIEVQSAMASGTGFTTTATGLTTANANDMLLMLAHDWNAGALGTRNTPTGASWLEMTDTILYAARVSPGAAGVQPNAVMTNANIVGQPWQAKMLALAPAGVTVTTSASASTTLTSPAMTISAGNATIPAQVIRIDTTFDVMDIYHGSVSVRTGSALDATAPAMTAATSDVTVITTNYVLLTGNSMTVSGGDVLVDTSFPADVPVSGEFVTALLNDVTVSIPIVANVTSPFMLASTQNVVASIKPLITITAMPSMSALTQAPTVVGKANVDVSTIAMTALTQTSSVVGKANAVLAAVPSMSAPVSGVTVKSGQTILVTSPQLSISTSTVGVTVPPAQSGWNHDRLDGPGSLAGLDRILISPPSLVPTESFSTIAHGAGTWYAEVTIAGSPAGYVGLYNEASDAGTEIVLSTGEVRELPSGVVTPTFAPIVDGDVIGIAYDGTDGQVWFRVNGGAWNNDPAQVPVA
jgi:hypothetical protein